MIKKSILIGAITGALIGGFTVDGIIHSYRAWSQIDETLKIVSQQQRIHQDAAVKKVKFFYMEQNERLWGDLAEYQAAATVEAARKHKVDLSILVGVVTKESEAHPFAKSRTGAIGCSQIDPKAHKDRFGVYSTTREMYDPKNNIDCAAGLLKEYTTKYGLKKALQVYNIGENGFRAGTRNPRYVIDVLKYSKKFKLS